MKISTSARNAGCAAIVALFDAAVGPGYIEIREGSEPTHPASTAIGTLLATIVLPAPAFDTSFLAAGTAVANDIGTVQAVADGDAGWFRAYDGDDNPIEDGSVSVSGGGGDMQLNTVSLSTGVDVEVTSWTINQPES